MKIYSDDGREFKNVNECNAYEANQKLKLQKEQEEHAKAIAKAEEERKIRFEKQKKLTQYREIKLKEINDILQKSKLLVDDYEKTTGNKLIYTNDLSTGNIVIRETRNSIDFAWDNVIEEICKAIRS